ncbi:MAG: glycosyltransferase [Candidatus Scalindua sp.]
MSRLAKHYRVLFVEPSRTSDEGTWPSIKNRYKNIFSPRLETIIPNLTLIYPSPSIPLGGALLSPAMLRLTTPRVIKLNCWLLAVSIRKVLRKLKVTNPILYIWEPFHLDLVGKFAEQLVCYHVYDETSDFVFNKRISQLIREYDMKLCKKGDFVFASSKKIYERRKPLNSFTYFIPNGVDYDHFHTAMSPSLKIPEDIQNIPNPIIGFAGSIMYFMVDTKLLIYLAETRPDWSILLVGPDLLDNSKLCLKLRALDNVFFVGKKDVAELPAYMKAFNVAMLPYVTAGHISSSYPLKFHEYLAAGKPIVASHVPALLPFKDVVLLSHSYDEFVQNIELALVNNSQNEIEKRLKIARENTWDQRVETIMGLLENSRKLKKDKKTVETIQE